MKGTTLEHEESATEPARRKNTGKVRGVNGEGGKNKGSGIEKRREKKGGRREKREKQEDRETRRNDSWK